MDPQAPKQLDEPQAMPGEVQIQMAGLPRQQSDRFTQLDMNGQPIVTGDLPLTAEATPEPAPQPVIVDIPEPQPPQAYVPQPKHR
jgi:hypothetical protein